jgi:TonB family protein
MDRLRLASILGALVALPTPALAQTAPTTPPATPPIRPEAAVTPPAVQDGTEVPYPAGAQGDAAVVLEVDVDKDGLVSNAVVTEGTEPFAEQARRSVLRWRFTPARRGVVPVAARIRARVQFHQEEAPSPSGPTAAPPAAQGTPAPSPAPAPASSLVLEVPEEVTVHGARHEVGETTLSAADVREMPGAFGDPFRAVEALPGVIPVVSGLPYFYIRGAPPQNNAYLVDGIRVPLLFHVGVGEGVIHPALIDHVDFYPGAAPAAYGHAAGAVIAGQTRDPATTPHGEVNLRLIDSGALLETPVDDGRGSVLVAGRYGYPGPVVSAITSTVQLGYWDYQTRATWRVSDRDTLGVFAFGSHDYLGTASTHNGQTGPLVEQLGSDFHRIDLRYDRALDDGHLRIAATLGYDAQGGAGLNSGSGGDSAGGAGMGMGNAPPPVQTPVITTATNLSAATRLEVDKKLSAAVRVRGGADAQVDHYRFSQGEAQAGQTVVPSSADPPPTNITWGAHADVVWRVTPRVEIVPGIRFDVFEGIRDNGPSGAQASTIVPAVDPRLSTRVTIAPWLAWLASFGLSHQYPVLRVGGIPALLVSVPGFPTGDSQLQTAAQGSQGLEFTLPADFTLTTTGFLSGWSGLTDLTNGCIQIMPATTPPQNGNAAPPPVPWSCPSNDPTHGIAYGVELLLRRPLSKRLSGWLSYTLSRSTRDEHFLTPSGGDVQATVVSDYDRTHVLNAVLAYDLGARWRAGGRLVFFTGTPYSSLAGNVPAPPYNDQRTSPFYRVDVRLEKRWSFMKSGTIAFIAEVQNVTLSKEQTSFGLDCTGGQTSPNAGVTTQCSPSTVGPLTIPSLGVEASF